MSDGLSNIQKNSLAGQILAKLTKTNDGKISKQVWNSLWNQTEYSAYKQGNPEANEINNVENIDIQDAFRYIMTRLFNAAKKGFNGTWKDSNGNLTAEANAEVSKAAKELLGLEIQSSSSSTVPAQTVSAQSGTTTSAPAAATSTVTADSTKTVPSSQTESVPASTTGTIPASGTESESDTTEGTTLYSSPKSILMVENLGNDKEEAKAKIKEEHPNAKFKTRTINGTKQEYAYYKDENGNTVRQLINDDGTAEPLIIISDGALKNKQFITQSALFEATGLTSLPEGVKCKCGAEGDLTFTDKKGNEIAPKDVKNFVPEEEKKKEQDDNTEISELTLMQKRLITALKKNPDVKVATRTINGKPQPYVLLQNGTRHLINENGDYEDIIQIGTVKGKKQFITVAVLKKETELEKLPDGIKCECALADNGTVQLTFKDAKTKNIINVDEVKRRAEAEKNEE